MAREHRATVQATACHLRRTSHQIQITPIAGRTASEAAIARPLTG